MAFKDVYNFKQVVLKEMESMGYDRPYIENNPRPTQSSASDNDFSDWTKHYMYRYYRDFFLNTNDLGTVVLNKDDIITFYNANLNRISNITNGNIHFDTWESNDFLPYLELVSFPVLNEDRSVKYAGMDITNEKPGSDYVLCYHDLQSPWPLIQKGEDDRLNVDIYARYGRGNNGFRGGLGLGYMDIATLCQSRINLQDIDADDKWLSLKTTMQAYDLEEWITLTPVEPNNDWRGAFIQSGQWLYKGKTPVREKDTFREYYFYRKFEYRNNDGVLLGYRYIPLTPFLAQQYAGNTATSSNVRPWGGGFYSDTQYPCFGFQPFNHNIIFDIGNDPDYTYDYMFSLPGLTYTQSESMNILAVNVDSNILQHGYTQLFMRYFEIWQYLYLCEIRFDTNESRAATIPYSDLMEGIPPTIDGGGGEGETAGQSGTVSGGGKEDIEGPGVAGGGGIAEGTVIKTYPVIDDYLEPGFYGGVYIPTYRYIMEVKDSVLGYNTNTEAVNKLNQIIRNLTALGKGNALVEVFMTYSGFINGIGVEKEGGPVVDNRYKLPVISINLERPVYLCGFNSNNGYLPKNKKLLSYPYLSFEINGYGEINELKPENWSEETPTINVCSKFLPGSPIFVFPSKYNGVQYNYDAGVAGQPLPVLPYTIDSYKNEYNACVNSRTAAITSLTETSISNGIYSVLGGSMAATKGASGITTKTLDADTPVLRRDVHNITAKGVSDLGSGIINGAQGLTNSAMSLHQGLREFEAQLKDVENRPLAIANQNASPSLPYLNSNAGAPFIVWKSIRREFAEKIDEFFSRYGYKVNKFKEVDIHTRPVFNFLKCSQARVEGSIPNEDLMQIKGILEKGITFWHDPSKILDYSVDNPAPITNKKYYYNGYYK